MYIYIHAYVYIWYVYIHVFLTLCYDMLCCSIVSSITHISLSLYIYIYMYVYVWLHWLHLSLSLYIYIYICSGVWKGTYGVSTNGVTASFMFFDSGTCGVPICQHQSTYLNCAYLFPHAVKHHYFCSDPTSVDPISPQPSQLNNNHNTQQSYINHSTINSTTINTLDGERGNADSTKPRSRMKPN